jgi:hypothetical protein
VPPGRPVAVTGRVPCGPPARTLPLWWAVPVPCGATADQGRTPISVRTGVPHGEAGQAGRSGRRPESPAAGGGSVPGGGAGRGRPGPRTGSGGAPETRTRPRTASSSGQGGSPAPYGSRCPEDGRGRTTGPVPVSRRGGVRSGGALPPCTGGSGRPYRSGAVGGTHGCGVNGGRGKGRMLRPGSGARAGCGAGSRCPGRTGRGLPGAAGAEGSGYGSRASGRAPGAGEPRPRPVPGSWRGPQPPPSSPSPPLSPTPEKSHTPEKSAASRSVSVTSTIVRS